jgi:hypothetical protein
MDALLPLTLTLTLSLARESNCLDCQGALVC